MNKIGIHYREGSFSSHWIKYCKENNISYKLVNAYSTDIIEQLKDCDLFMWDFHHHKFEDTLFAKQLLFSLEQTGKKVFPSSKTAWHFDDKVGQKYLLENEYFPFVKSYVFYDKESALIWAKETNYPKVFKLRGGAGASNVQLIRSYKENAKIIKKTFKKGYSSFNKHEYLANRISRFKSKQDSWTGLLKGIKVFLTPPEYAQKAHKEKGYVYYQDFIPNNNFDIRIIVIGDKAFGIKRMNRENDFRASGSGLIVHDPSSIDLRCVQIAFDVNKKLKFQCMSYDFVFDKNGPLIVEISYRYTASGYEKCPGYWDSDLNWFPGKFNPQYWMVENLLLELY